MSGSGTGGGGGGGSSGGGSGRAHFRSQLGCCICGTKSSSSRFTSSQRYAEHFGACFGPQGITRSGDLCNACVLCVKRWLQRGRQPNFFVQVLDSKKGPGPKHMKEITKRARRREAKQQAAAAIASPVGKEQKSLKSSLTTTTHTPTTRSSCGNGHHCSNNSSCSRGNLHYTQTNAKPEHYLHTSSSCIRVQSNMFSQQSYVGGTTRSSAQHSQALSNGFRCSSHKNSNNNRNSNSHCYNRSLNHHNKNDTSEHICCSCTILEQKEYLSKSSHSQGATRTRAAAARQLEAASAAAACTRNTAGVLSTSLPLCGSHHHSSSSSLVLHSKNIQMTISPDSSENDPNNSYDINQQTCCSETATSASSCSSCCYFCCCSSCCAYGGGSLSCCSGSTSGFGSNSSDISLNSSVNYSRTKSNTYHNKKQHNCSNCTCHDNKTDEISKCSMDYNCSTHRSYYHHQSRRANEFRYPQLPQTGQVNINSNEGEKGASIFTNGNSGNFQHSNNTQQTSYVTSGQNNSIVNINESASPIANTNVTTTSLTTTTTIPTRRYNRRVVLPPVRMTHNPEVDSLLREIMERNSQAVNFDSREMHMAVQQELRLRNRTIHTAASASGGSISSISSADGSIEATVGSSSQTSTNRAKCSHHHSSPNHEHLAKRHCSHHCYFSCD
ncbi:unnamed protein product [Schistosoma rodhaini]|uniref:Protein FAM60A n=4 Tax=Schistosoma mansoni TaxID=6183 RepID=A0A3Q0KQE4_SCHMA|nr:unnamed protein product [Schistosoma rodhaini]